MSVAAPADFNPEEADNLEDVRTLLSGKYYSILRITNNFVD